MLWQRIGINLHDWSDDDEVPVRTFGCDLVEQLNVKPLINHAKEAETWMRNVCLIFRIFYSRSRFAEVCRIDAARKGIDCRVLIALHFIKTLAASENEIDVA